MIGHAKGDNAMERTARPRCISGRGGEFQIGDFRFQKDDGSLKWRAEKLSFEILVSAIILEEIRRSDSIRAW